MNNSNITNGNHTYNNNNTAANNIQQPPQKRLYIKHGQLDTIINTKIIPKTTAVVSAAAASVTANKPSTMPHLVRQSPPSLGYSNTNSNNDNKPSSRPSPGQVNGRGVLVVQPNQFKTTAASTAAVQNGGAAKNGGVGVVPLQKPAVASQQTNQNFKLSSILSATTLSMNKNKPFSMSVSPAPASKPSSIIQQSMTTQFNANKSIPNNQQQKPITTNIVKVCIICTIII